MPSDSLSELLAFSMAVSLTAARAVPIVWMVAPLGGGRLTPTVRVGFALALAVLAAPAARSLDGGAAMAIASASASALPLALSLGREVLIGFCLGFVGAAPFRAAEAAGMLADGARGAALAEVTLPTSDERSSPLGVLYLLVAVTVFLAIGGVPRFLEALLDSYRLFPVFDPAPDAAAHAATFDGLAFRRVALVLVGASVKLLADAVSLAAPVLVACLLADVALALVVRAAREVPVYFLGLPLKALLSVSIVLLGVGTFAGAVATGTVGWLGLARRALSGVP